jgi:uncharacterized protein (DUF983 family)
MAEKHHSDLPAAYTGLIVGAIVLLLAVGAMVKLVNSHHAKAEAGQLSHN